MTDELQTPQLLLSPLTIEHADDLFRVFSDEETLRYWHHLPHREAYETTAMIWSLLAAPQDRWWTVIHRESSQAVGMVNTLGSLVPGMGYILHRDYWRQGYGTEAVNAALDYGFTTLRLNRVELWIHKGNIASQRLAHKIGFKQRGQFYQRYPHNSEPHETLVFGLRADEWAAKTQQSFDVQSEIPFLTVHPILPVRNVPESVAFYRERLGFHAGYVGGDPPDFAVMSRGEWSSEQVNIQLRHSDELRSIDLYIMIGPYIDQLHDEYREKGVTIKHPPTTQPWGIRDFSVEDNSGHKITFGSTV